MEEAGRSAGSDPQEPGKRWFYREDSTVREAPKDLLLAYFSYMAPLETLPYRLVPEGAISPRSPRSRRLQTPYSDIRNNTARREHHPSTSPTSMPTGNSTPGA